MNHMRMLKWWGIATIGSLIALFISHLITKDTYWHGWASGTAFGSIYMGYWLTKGPQRD